VLGVRRLIYFREPGSRHDCTGHPDDALDTSTTIPPKGRQSWTPSCCWHPFSWSLYLLFYLRPARPP